MGCESDRSSQALLVGGLSLRPLAVTAYVYVQNNEMKFLAHSFTLC